MEKVLVILVFSHQILLTSSQILGAGTGIGSCRAAPFRSANVNWDVCPPTTPCCSEYGYCRTREEWKQLKFRDCNGVSNGIDLPLSVLILEEQLRRGANSPGLNPEDITNQLQNALQNQNQNNRFNQNQNSALSNQNQNNRFNQNQNAGFQSQQSNLQNQQGSLNQNNQNLNNFLSNAVFSGTSSSSGSSSSSSSASSSSSSSSESSLFGGFVPNNPVFGQSSSSSASSSSSSAASSANNFENQNTFQIVSGAGGAGAGGVGVLSGVVTGVTGGGATGISEGQAVSISLISQNSGSKGNQGSKKKKKKKKNPFGFGNRVTVTKKPNKPNNINQILENISEESNKEKPPKRKIVIRPQNTKPAGGQKGQYEKGSPLVGYQNTGGYPMDLNGANCPNYPFCWWNPYKRNN